MFRYIIIFIFSFTSCTVNSEQVKTSKEFINTGTVDTSVYTKDCTAIIADLYNKMQKHQSSFYSKEYFDSTLLIIDKILYDSIKNKVAVFVLVENPTSRRKSPDLNYKIYYHAFCYLGKRIISDAFELKWFSTLSLINFYDKEEISTAIERRYFTELSAIIDGDDQPVYKYNLNDKRFWAGPGWKKFFD